MSMDRKLRSKNVRNRLRKVPDSILSGDSGSSADNNPEDDQTILKLED